jgi:ribosome biogenesis GTPase
MTAIKIEELGWNKFFKSRRSELGLGGFPVAKVIAQYKGAYKVKNENGEFLAKITGRQLFQAKSQEDYPAVGDWVVVSELNNEQAVIKAVLPRKSIIKRRFGDKNRTGEKNDIQIIATNIDVAFIVESVGRDYNVNRLERYLAIANDASIKPVIIINKTDLITTSELDYKLAEIKNRIGDIDIIFTSAVNNEGLDKLRDYIQKGETCCFLGSSGVGKSSLINKLLGKEDIKTGDISSYSDRGKHITTNREMYFMESGGIVIDNPGIREVGMANVGLGVDSLFDEIARLAEKCKYADCKHILEPGCEVLSALKDGRLDEDRYSNYVNLKKEIEYVDMSQSEKREKNRSFGKFIKNAKKELKKSGHKNF